MWLQWTFSTGAALRSSSPSCTRFLRQGARWINRSSGMGASSLRLVRVGGGYWRVLLGIWLKQTFGVGPFRDLRRQRLREQSR